MRNYLELLDAQSQSLLIRTGRSSLNAFISTQLNDCYNEEVNAFVLTTNEIDTREVPNWAQLSIRWPEHREGQYFAKVHLLQIAKRNGDHFEAQKRDSSLRGQGDKMDAVNIQSGRTPISDIAKALELNEEDTLRLEMWAEANANDPKARPMILKPIDDSAYFAFSIRISINPDTGALAQNPVGIDQLEFNAMTLAEPPSSRTFTSFGLKLKAAPTIQPPADNTRGL